MRSPAFLRAFRDVKRFRGLPLGARRIVFYAETGHSRVHFEPVIAHLTKTLERSVCYVTSSIDDPILDSDNERIESFYVGEGSACTYFFMNLEADIVVVTMPDLETFHKKRSRVYPVHYVYIFHSIVSTHMIYRRGAFDHYDTIFAVGPHHLEEVRATEKAYDLAAKKLFEHGYGRLDSILAASDAGTGLRSIESGAPTRVLVAPSWGADGLLETKGDELVVELLEAGCHVTLRPHPETGKRWPRVVRGFDRFAADERFVLETDIASKESLLAADLMVSDWSGAALEFAFGLERPVLFVDLPRKVNNPEYERIRCEPLEASIRSRIGEVVAPDRLANIGSTISRLMAEPARLRDEIRAVRTGTVYNVGKSGVAGAEHLADLADEIETSRTSA